uniref:Uncharacterized protein n=1 Tax=Rhipicephalus zambeziensis TaxID=60191 RepID=A0A224YB70_9ACAR
MLPFSLSLPTIHFLCFPHMPSSIASFPRPLNYFSSKAFFFCIVAGVPGEGHMGESLPQDFCLPPPPCIVKRKHNENMAHSSSESQSRSEMQLQLHCIVQTAVYFLRCLESPRSVVSLLPVWPAGALCAATTMPCLSESAQTVFSSEK